MGSRSQRTVFVHCNIPGSTKSKLDSRIGNVVVVPRALTTRDFGFRELGFAVDLNIRVSCQIRAMTS
jgi:hypothetical protein